MGVIINNPPVCKIDGVHVSSLKQITDDRGAVLHMLRADSSFFMQFGEVYFSETNPGAIKAWKCHKKMTQFFAVPVGMIKFVFFDDRHESSTFDMFDEIVLGRPDNYYLVKIDPMIWYGFQNIIDKTALLVNCTDLPHDPGESETKDLYADCFHYNWQRS
jgi:dTDP-4-dehydrorhamnose 3,5-epimerase